MRQNRAETLRRRMELYRRLMSKGVDADLARVYLFEIAEAELEWPSCGSRLMSSGPGELLCAGYPRAANFSSIQVLDALRPRYWVPALFKRNLPQRDRARTVPGHRRPFGMSSNGAGWR
jgi:hypothetical protein